MNTYIEKFIIELFYLLNEMSFYLLLGFLFSGILYVFFPRKKIYRFFCKNNFVSVMNAAIMGIPIPLCSCGVIPAGISLYKNGASKGSAVSFLISTPQTGIDSIMLTYSLLGFPFAIIRALIALITGLLGGILVNIFEKNNQNQTEKTLEKELNQEKKQLNFRNFKEMLKYGFVTFLQDLSKWLIIGILLATIISVVLPNDFFVSYLSNPSLQMLIVLIGAIPLYVCATGSVPIAAALIATCMSPGAALVFLMAGPATNMATITVIGKTLGRKTLIIYLISIISVSLLFGFLINSFLPENWFSVANFSEKHDNHGTHEIIPFWLKFGSSILLIALIINGYIQKYIMKKNINKKNDSQKSKIYMETIKIKVEGMTCNHCKMNVESNIQKMQGVENAIVSLSDAEVEISEENIDLSTIKKKIEDLGYEFKGMIE